MKQADVPIVLVPFGTRTSASSTYDRMNARFVQTFPDSPISWVFTSRTVRSHSASSSDSAPGDIRHALRLLAEQGSSRCVVQSLHILPAWEFHTMIREIRDSGPPLDVSIGKPLLGDPEDFAVVLEILSGRLLPKSDEAVILVGHGTDHPADALYDTLNRGLRERCGERVWLQRLQGSFWEEPLEVRVLRTGTRSVRFVPFLLTAGWHVRRDVMGDEPRSWRCRLEAAGVTCSCPWGGLGEIPGISGLFARHTGRAMARFSEEPLSERSRMLVIPRDEGGLR